MQIIINSTSKTSDKDTKDLRCLLEELKERYHFDWHTNIKTQKSRNKNSHQVKKDEEVTLTTANHLETRSPTEEDNSKRVKTVGVDNQPDDIELQKPKCIICGSEMENITDSKTRKISKYLWRNMCKHTNNLVLSRG